MEDVPDLKSDIQNEELGLKLTINELEANNSGELINQPKQIYQAALLTSIKKEPDSSSYPQDTLLFDSDHKKIENIKIEDVNIKSVLNDETLHNLQGPGPSRFQDDVILPKVEPMEEGNDGDSTVGVKKEPRGDSETDEDCEEVKNSTVGVKKEPRVDSETDEDCEEVNLTFKCGFCSQMFNNNSSLDNHLINIHSNEDNMLSLISSEIHMCKFDCDFKTVFPRRLKRHVARKHKNDGKERQKSFECLECAYKTVKKKVFISHMKKHKDVHSKISMRCESCNIMCRGQRGLDSHILYKHSTEDIANNIHSKVYTCQVCFSYKAVYRANIKWHMKETHEENMLACSYCKFKTELKSELIQHEKTHNSDLEANKCSACNKRFLTETKLSKHIVQKHNRNKELLATVTCTYRQCELCDFCFITTALLNKHKRLMHSVELALEKS